MSELWDSTTNNANNKPLSLEDIEKMVETWKNTLYGPSVELLSPREYLRRLGYRKPLSADWVDRLMEEHRQ